MSNNSDRVQKWGELLAELANDAKKFEREKQNKLFLEKKRYRNFYKTLELEAADFQPKKFKPQLSMSLKRNNYNAITVFSFTCNLAKHNDYQNFLLSAFKTKAFTHRPCKILLHNFWGFIAIVDMWLSIASITGLCLFIFKFIKDSLSWGIFIEWLILTILIVLGLFVLGLFLSWLFNSALSHDKESFISILEKDLGKDFTKEILISDRRQIKLPELRLLFLELEKFELQPVLIIHRETKSKVRFELQIKNSSKFIELLQ